MNDAQDSLVHELKSLPCWPAPVQAIRPLTGLSGGSLLIELCDGRRYVARSQNAQLQMQGVSREREWQVLCAIGEQVASSDFLPQVLFYNARWLVVSWLEGSPWPHTLADDACAQRHLVTLMRRFHPVDSELQLDIPSRLQFYRQQLSAEKQPDVLFSLCARFASLRSPSWWFPVLAHHDIHPGNLVSDGATLALIDWEYAARSPLACELILLFEANGFNRAQRQQFCRYYAETVYPTETVYAADSECVGSSATALEDWLHRLQQDIVSWQPWCEMLMAMWSAIRFEQTDDAQYAVWRDNYLKAAEQSLGKRE
ncbi:phosphotransferase [Plesiomonas shigelloides]